MFFFYLAGVWCMVHGVWCMVYGVWCMVYGAFFMNVAEKLSYTAQKCFLFPKYKGKISNISDLEILSGQHFIFRFRAC